MTPDETVLLEIDGHVARVTINRADKRNALNPDVVRNLKGAFDEAAASSDVWVIVLTGAGDKAFCAGADLGVMDAASRVERHFERSEIGQLFTTMRGLRQPIVARVNGHALAGGFGLMLACDLVIAARDAQLGTPEINVGLWPFMISAIIHRDIPRKVALELMLTGGRLSAEEGERWGFVNRVVDRTSLDDAIGETTAAIASKSPLVTALGKRSFYRAEDMPLPDALEYLSGMLTVCLESEDAMEGVSAFLQKRQPEWQGR